MTPITESDLLDPAEQAVMAQACATWGTGMVLAIKHGAHIRGEWPVLVCESVVTFDGVEYIAKLEFSLRPNAFDHGNTDPAHGGKIWA